MIARAPAIGWGVLLATALAASPAPPAIQFAYAVVAIGGIGMAHGASDLAIVRPGARPAFLLLYALVSATCLVWWLARPAQALPLFLAASALHFAVEDAPSAPVIERALRGIGLVATPATLHIDALRVLFGHAAGVATIPAAPVVAMAVAGGVSAAVLLAAGGVRRDVRLVTGTLALLLLPPLVGFSAGFLILHAVPQTEARRIRLGCATTIAYARAIAPVLAGAAVLAITIAAALLHRDPTGTRALFAALAALAMPHLLVTPWFERQADIDPLPRRRRLAAPLR